MKSIEKIYLILQPLFFILVTCLFIKIETPFQYKSKTKHES